MKLRTLIIIMLCPLCFAEAADGQKPAKSYTNVALGLNRRGQDSTLVSLFNVGLLDNTDTLRGVQIGAVSSVVRRRMNGVNIGGLFALTAGKACGVQISGVISSVGGEMCGAQISGVSNIAHSFKGVQISPFSNISTRPFTGMQISMISNISMGIKCGMQLSALANISSSYMRGMQIGSYNYADTLNGSQFGLLNVCVSHPRGAQIGLFNYSRDTLGHKIGLVNVNPKTTIDILTFLGTSSKINFGLRFRNRSTYSIVGVGTHYMGLNKRFSGALFYRLGQYFNVTPRLSLSSDIGFYHIETFEENTADKPQRLYSLQLRVNADYRIGEFLGAFVSLGYGDTRYYHHADEYRNRAIVEAGLSLRYHHNKKH
jgi:hypothetical protein